MRTFGRVGLGLAHELETLRAKKRGGQKQRYDRQPGERKRVERSPAIATAPYDKFKARLNRS